MTNETGTSIPHSAFELLRTRHHRGGMDFPSSDDYNTMASALIIAGAAPSVAYEAAQRNWFQRGQTGCVFARIAAFQPSDQWPYLVETEPESTDWEARLEAKLIEMEMRHESQVISVLFPLCQTLANFWNILERLMHNGVLWQDQVTHHDGGTTLEIRRSLKGGVTAWVMAFGPHNQLPATRQSPYFEFAYRAKPKPEKLYRKLNHDRDIAHLADYPLDMSERHWDHRWQTTEARTRKILGSEPDYISAAKSTLTLPAT